MKIGRLNTIAPAIGVSLVLLLLASHAAAATPASPSASVPSASALMKHVAEAMGREKIAHGAGTSGVQTSIRTRSGVKTESEKGWFSGNATLNGSQRSQIREKLARRIGSKTEVRSIEYVTRGLLLAERETGSTHWMCGSTAGLETIPVWTPDSFQFTLPKKPARSWVAGSARFQGAGVWKVKFAMKSGNSKSPSSVSGMYLVDKHAFVIRRVSVTTDTVQGGRPLHETSFVTLTKFGNVPLPKLPRCA